MSAISPAVRAASAPAVDGPLLTGTAWFMHGQLSLRDWLGYGRRLGTIGRSVNWWIGDWLRYGNTCYGERYARAARATGYDTQSLMNMVYVASKFDPSRRRDSLSWSHHAELAALDEPDQERWLALAATHRMSVHSLRLELRAWRRSSTLCEGETPDVCEPTRDDLIVCPNCKQAIVVYDGNAIIQGPERSEDEGLPDAGSMS
jgi:hypothetical protein